MARKSTVLRFYIDGTFDGRSRAISNHDIKIGGVVAVLKRFVATEPETVHGHLFGLINENAPACVKERRILAGWLKKDGKIRRLANPLHSITVGGSN